MNSDAKSEGVRVLLLRGLGRLLFVVVPAVFFVYYGYYLLALYMISQGMSRFTFIPGVVSFVSLIYITKMCMGGIVSGLSALKKSARRRVDSDR